MIRARWLFPFIFAILLIGAFAWEAHYRNQVCISALTVDASNTIETYTPKECT